MLNWFTQYRLSREASHIKQQAFRDLEADIAKRLAAQQREDDRAMKRLALMRGRAVHRMRSA